MMWYKMRCAKYSVPWDGHSLKFRKRRELHNDRQEEIS